MDVAVLKAIVDILGNTLIPFLKKSQMRKTVPLSYLSVQKEAGARRQLAERSIKTGNGKKQLTWVCQVWLPAKKLSCI